MNNYTRFFLTVLAAFLANFVLGFFAISYFVGEIPVKSSMSESTEHGGAFCFFWLTALTIASFVYIVRYKRRVDKETPSQPVGSRLLIFLFLTLHVPLALIYGILLLFFSAEIWIHS
jgi:positive regulator of sigma E activity